MKTTLALGVALLMQCAAALLVLTDDAITDPVVPTRPAIAGQGEPEV